MASDISLEERIKVKVIATGDVSADVELLFKAQDLGLTNLRGSFFEEEKRDEEMKEDLSISFSQKSEKS